jgi:glucose/arabinose dehydrogenase
MATRVEESLQFNILNFFNPLNNFVVPFAALLLLVICFPSGVEAVTLPSGFQESVVFSGLTYPTVVRFAPDGRVFVAEKSGLIKVFNGLNDTSPDIVADLRTKVQDYWDRGLLGLAIDPEFPTKPYIYVLFTFDAPLGGTAPTWGDTCPTPPGPTTDGCVVTGRLSRLQVSSSNTLVGTKVLISSNWCQQFPSHSIGTLAFGSDGALYVSAGDGASFTNTDYGQYGGSSGSPTPKNPCGDPPAPVGGSQTPPSAEGGALRSQDIRTMSDPLGYNGAILRLNPDTGEALPTNPLYGGDSADDAIIAYGLRNPFRFTIRPSDDELWIGDVGWRLREEINRIPDPLALPIRNFGWPCYEGNAIQGGYDVYNLSLCESLYSSGTAIGPYYSYHHDSHVDPAGDQCRTGSSSISGIAFYNGGAYPTNYDGALFFADYSRDCIYVIRKGSNGLPDLATRTAFGVDAGNPVDLEIGPGGDLYYVDLEGGAIRRIVYFTGNQPPIAVAQANPTSGIPPLTVSFDASASSDPDPGSTLSYKWDLDGDGQYDDSTLVKPSYTYQSQGSAYTVMVRLLVTDDDGATATDQVPISVGNSPPTATILTPLSSLKWKVGDVISFSGKGTDPENGQLPPSSMSWEIIMHHCPSDCHTHSVQSFSGVDHGTFAAPDHEYPSQLEIKLTVKDSGNLNDQASVSINPQTVALTFQTNPSGLNLVVTGIQGKTPFSRTVIVNSKNSLSAPSPQTLSTFQYNWVSWSDGGAQNHQIVAGSNPATYLANYSTTCTFTIAPTSQSFSHKGGTGSVTVTAPPGCHWTAVSNKTWIVITSGSSGNGNGVVRYSVVQNLTSTKRTGTITVAGKTFTVIQNARKSK